MDHGGVEVTYFNVDVEPLMVSRSMARALSRQVPQFDLVHIHGLYRFPLAAAAHYARAFKVPYLIYPMEALIRISITSVSGERLSASTSGPSNFPICNRAALIHYTTEEEMRRADFLTFPHYWCRHSKRIGNEEFCVAARPRSVPP